MNCKVVKFKIDKLNKKTLSTTFCIRKLNLKVKCVEQNNLAKNLWERVQRSGFLKFLKRFLITEKTKKLKN